VAVAYVTSNVFAIAGRDGKNIFIAKAPMAERQINVKMLGGVKLFKNMGCNFFLIPVGYICICIMSRDFAVIHICK
tara:strand:- start:915 stop:1142 length:228 start_codon:yes stop_codon:yes gene_type:complete